MLNKESCKPSRIGYLKIFSLISEKQGFFKRQHKPLCFNKIAGHLKENSLSFNSVWAECFERSAQTLPRKDTNGNAKSD